MNILLGVTGSVAAKLTDKMIKGFANVEFYDDIAVLRILTLRVITTERSLYFWDPTKALINVYTDKDERPGQHYVKDAPILHIELAKWANVLAIAPLTANTLAKMANGICDNLLTSVVRAWDLEKPIVLAPAMNTKMWDNPFTQEHLAKLWLIYRNKITIVDPVSKKLACGDEGMGAMADIKDIVAAVSAAVR